MKNLFTTFILVCCGALGYAQELAEPVFATAEQFSPKQKITYLRESMQSGNVPEPSAGDYLIKFSRQYYTGVGLIAGGTVLQFAGAVSANDAVVIAGGFVSLGGIVVILTSFQHIGKAGRMLKQQERRESTETGSLRNIKLHSGQDGVGLSMHF